MKFDRVTEKVKFLGYRSGKAMLDTEFQATTDGGKTHFTQHFSQQVRVNDPDISSRLEKIKVGDHITATVYQELEGDFKSYLEDFELIDK